jgi:hypothetical protein
MKRAFALVLVLAACGDNVAHDVPEFMPECHDIPQPSADPFQTAASVDAVSMVATIPGTLASWDPTGRWFLTGPRVGGVSSFAFEPRGAAVLVDGEPGAMDDTSLFWRGMVQSGQASVLMIKRVSNRAADGSLRAERLVCDGDMCRVCTAKMIYATHNDDEGEGDHISLVGQLNDPAWPAAYTLNVRVVGNTAYLIRRDGLHIIDVADPTHPTELGVYARPMRSGAANDIKLVEANAKRYALIGDVPVDVVDVTDPAHPAFVLQIPEEAHTLAVESRDGKTYAYFGNYDAKCPIYDITDPAHPMKLGSFSTPGSLVHDLSLENGIAYLNAWDAGFYVVDYTNPAMPVQVGRWATTTAFSSHSSWPMRVGDRHIALHGDENYNAHLDVVDVDPASATFMQSIGSYKTRDWISIHNLRAFANKAYFTYYQEGVRVLDMSDPTQPKQVGYYNTWDPQADYTTSQFFEGAVGLDVDVARKLIFVADSPRGLLILRDETP